uniref:PLAC8 family protein n=1 Tax=Kalanchoe fedtschenkoi TaxID=63787 RepID=A0A7N0UNZ8_KALFE
MTTENGTAQGEIEDGSSGKVKSHVPLRISSSQKAFLGKESSENSFPDKLKAMYCQVRNFATVPGRVSLSSPSAKFWRMADVREEASRAMGSVSSHSLRDKINDKINGVFSRKIDWASLRKLCKEWFRNPINMALFAWIVCVAVSGAILFLVMTGMLNAVIPKKSARNAWFEVNNQILNALFTLMCLYQHPKRIYHLILLIRWAPEDISKLRKVYCKNGTYKPHEWAHIMVVIALLNLNCFAQYALCGLNLGYKRSERPAIGVGITISVAIGAPAVAGLYCIMSPLGREYGEEGDEEAPVRMASPLRPQALQKRYSFASRDEHRIIESSPQWSGGIFDFWDDISTAYLSLFCTFCVFGWNMERLGFGNMYVHIATFLLFCMAPFFIFNLAAINIDNETVREALGFTGLVLCVFGLLYGGFWRIQMRRRFNLPGSGPRPAVTDCALWLCCCWCSLAQEVRTGNAYDIVEDKFCKKLTEDNGNHLDDATAEINLNRITVHESSTTTQAPMPCDMSDGAKFSTAAAEVTSLKDENMSPPPVVSSIHREQL